MSTLKGIIAFSIAGLFLLYEFVLQVSPQVMAKDIIGSTGASTAMFGTMASMYFYAYAPGQLFTGISYDRFGAKLTLFVSCLLCTSGSLLIFLFHNIYIFGLGRMLTGLGSASAFVGALYIGKQYFGTRKFFLVVGVTELLGCIGAIVGIVPLAFLVVRIGWVYSMLVFVIVGFVLLFFMSTCIQSVKKKPQPVKHVPGASRKRIKEILTNNQTWAIGLYALTLFAPVTILASLWGVPFLESIGLDIESASVAIAIIWVGIAIGSLGFSFVSERLRRRKPLLTFFPILGFVVSIGTIYLTGSYVFTILFLFVFGIAISGQALSFNVVSDNNKMENAGTAMGFHNMFVVLSGAIFQPIASYLINLFNGDSNDITYSSFALALSIIPVLFLLSYLIAKFWLKESKAI
jgi:MFS family permease